MTHQNYDAIIVGLFLAGTSAARLSGVWQNQISQEEYIRRVQNLNDPLYQHNRGQVRE
jgi:hypothetical protein